MASFLSLYSKVIWENEDMSSRESRGLSLRAVSKSFGRGFKTVPVLRELDLEICSGELVTAMGASGGGKTT